VGDGGVGKEGTGKGGPSSWAGCIIKLVTATYTTGIPKHGTCQ
jgi:hypothetical protein